MNRMIIRETLPIDFDDISQCVFSAFQNDVEVALVRQLRADNDVVIELVAEEAGSIVGHVLVSHLSLNPNISLQCGGVAPLSVLPSHQSNGIGSRLMEAVIERSRSVELDALFLLGDPDYYQRFGFGVTDISSDYPAEFFQAFELTPQCLNNVSAKANYANAFSAL
ncbi:putative acetyltransferase [gamma proteobacterium HIMB55]|nr:putative acetyltransferase [gamma proteobacterium HIMB55]